MTEIKTVINKDSYSPVGKITPHKVVRFEVEAVLDMCPGTWHDPEDLMNWIASNSYVRQVTLIDRPSD